ncbi:glutathione S-transferase family protein [Pigmentiphaga litoralis]|uniref:Glutathione S-transferase n=1 Tax=Pigmentiphaga litoralis TaxID=516702 RepID=A0A7Y9IYV5_9BURK|nr:glutathione S-transferase family protein [Pigmentiphaga litoralis]NYE26419.1 glutathione S-transferase [Pigmentiphaga litoralis]NYE85539.1 glutathione S-transferase [Pigmentiphaga litoralis]
MSQTTLTISSKTYSSWSMRGWLLARFAKLPFDEVVIALDDPAMRAEILLLAPSMLVPCLQHGKIKVWDTLAIGEYLNEIKPKAGLLPSDGAARAHCRAICGEMHSGFGALRAALPMNLKGHFPGFKIWARAQADIDRITAIWESCLDTYGGPYLFGSHRTAAEAMYAPVVTRFMTYDVPLSPACTAYCETVMALPEVQEWVDAAKLEPEEVDLLDMEF